MSDPINLDALNDVVSKFGPQSVVVKDLKVISATLDTVDSGQTPDDTTLAGLRTYVHKFADDLAKVADNVVAAYNKNPNDANAQQALGALQKLDGDKDITKLTHDQLASDFAAVASGAIKTSRPEIDLGGQAQPTPAKTNQTPDPLAAVADKVGRIDADAAATVKDIQALVAAEGSLNTPDGLKQARAALQKAEDDLVSKIQGADYGSAADNANRQKVMRVAETPIETAKAAIDAGKSVDEIRKDIQIAIHGQGEIGKSTQWALGDVLRGELIKAGEGAQKGNDQQRIQAVHDLAGDAATNDLKANNRFGFGNDVQKAVDDAARQAEAVVQGGQNQNTQPKTPPASPKAPGASTPQHQP